MRSTLKNDLGSGNEGRCCDAVLRVIEKRDRGVRSIRSIDTEASPGVEIRCEIAGQLYALEHTTLDPYPDRRADDRRFLEVLQPLAQSLTDGGFLHPQRGYQLHVETHAFKDTPRSRFPDIRSQIQAWVIDNLDGLDPPRRGRAAVRIADPPRLPLKVLLHCYEAFGQMQGRCSIARLAPDNLEALRRERVRATVASKGPKLHAEHVAGSKAILVLEDFDIAISNQVVIGDAIHAELDQSAYDIDEVYLVETHTPPEWTVFLLRRGSERWPTEDENPPMWTFQCNELKDLTATGGRHPP